jgi:chromate transporter
MNVIVLYLLLCKAMLTSFSGPTSLPVVQHDLVERHHVITQSQLTAAVAAGRATPGPFGLYLVSVGYFAAGVPGAAAGLLALVTPAFLIIPMLRYLGHRVNRPAVRSSIRAVTLASAGLLFSSTLPLGRECLTSPAMVAIAACAFVFLAATKSSTIWVVAAGAAAGLATALFR